MSDENYDPDYRCCDNCQMFYLKWDLGKNIWPRICPECYYCEYERRGNSEHDSAEDWEKYQMDKP
jgi:hypothetical protein